MVIATADTRRHLPLLPIRGSDTLGRFVAVAQRLTMGATPKKRRRSETGQETAVAFAVAVPVLLLCLTMRRGHSRGCEREEDFLSPSPSSSPLSEGWIDAYSRKQERVNSPSFFHIRLR